MEFMPFIPDLEVFIDKTIKKCLLEYDLDANDTEAVLDDMEKAWPKSPARLQEKQVLRDYNDNADNGRGKRQTVGASDVEGERVLDSKLDNPQFKDCEKVLRNEARGLSDQPDSKVGRQEEVLSNEKKEPSPEGGECNMSDLPSLSFGDGKSQVHRHPKPKSRLQQRYFEGNKSSESDRDRTTMASEGKAEDNPKSDALEQSNLDLLASAAKLHTEANRGREETRTQIIRHFQQKPLMGVLEASSRRHPTSSVIESESAKEVPSLFRLMSARVPQSHPVQHNNNNKSNNNMGVSGPNYESFVTRPLMMPLSESRPQEQKATSNPAVEKAKKHFQLFSGQSPRETVVVRRGLMSPSSERDFSARNRQAPTTVAQHVLPQRTPVEQSIFVAHNHNSPISSHSQWYNQQQHLHFSDTSYQPLHQRSRIATIIAEELEKDDDDQLPAISGEPIPSTNVVTSPDAKRLNAKEHQHSKSDKPYTDRRSVSGRPSPISRPRDPFEMSHHVTRRDESLAKPYSGNFSVLLPAHSTKLSRGLVSAILTDQVRRETCSKDKTSSMAGSSSLADEDEQPQDLSIKSRNTGRDEGRNDRHFCLSSHPESPLTEPGSRGYFSTPCSPLSTSISASHIESPALRKSPSPSNNSDRECDYNLGNDRRRNPLRNSGKWEKKGQVHGLDVFTSEVKDSKVLVERRRLQTLKRWTDTNVSETSKRRKME